MSTASVPVEVAEKNRKLGLRLGLVALFMIAMSPVLYWTGNMICNWVGVGFNADQVEKDLGGGEGRFVKSIFSADIGNPALEGKVRFWVDERTQRIEVGEQLQNNYHIENISNETLYIRPIHHVSPPLANRKFLMTQCFCYNDMELKPGQGAQVLPVVYGFQNSLDVRVNEAIISYTLEVIEESDLRERIEMPNEGPFMKLETSPLPEATHDE